MQTQFKCNLKLEQGLLQVLDSMDDDDYFYPEDHMPHVLHTPFCKYNTEQSAGKEGTATLDATGDATVDTAAERRASNGRASTSAGIPGCLG